jgi:hypothetical protein
LNSADDTNVTAKQAKQPRAPRGGFNYELWILNYEWKSFKTWCSGVLAVKIPTTKIQLAQALQNNEPRQSDERE